MQIASFHHPSFCFCDSFQYIGNGRSRSIKLGTGLKLRPQNSSQYARTLAFPGGCPTSEFFVPVQKNRLFVIPNTDHGHASVSLSEENLNMDQTSNHESAELFDEWSPLKSLWRGLSFLILFGQVVVTILKGKIHWKNTLQQLERVGPKSTGVCLLTSAFVGMAFTIQFVREFTRLGLNRSVNGVLALAFARELSPVITSIVVAGRIGSAFAAELGTMQVSEQTDTLRVLGTDAFDYLVTPRVIASCVALPLLTLMCFTVGLASSALLSDAV